MDFLDSSFFDKYHEPIQNHICSIYKSKNEQFSLVIPFIAHGIANNEKCMYIIDENTRTDVLIEFNNRMSRDIRFDPNKIVFMTKNEAYLRDGYFDPNRMIDFFKEEEANTLKAGFNGIRITGEMTWIFTKSPGVERFLEYEAKLNYFFPESKARAICQNNENRFEPGLLIDVIYTHPVVGLYGNLYPNPYYMSPDLFFLRKKNNDSPQLYNRIRDNILNQTSNHEKM